MEQQKQNDISTEVQTFIGAQAMQIISLTKRNQELETMLKALEKENNELTAKKVK